MAARSLRLLSVFPVALSLWLCPGRLTAQGDSTRALPRPAQDTTAHPPLYILVTQIGEYTPYQRQWADSSIVRLVRGPAKNVLEIRAAVKQEIAENTCSDYQGACSVVLFREVRQSDGFIEMQMQIEGGAYAEGPPILIRDPPEVCPRRSAQGESWRRCINEYFVPTYIEAILDHNKQHSRAGGPR